MRSTLLFHEDDKRNKKEGKKSVEIMVGKKDSNRRNTSRLIQEHVWRRE